MVFYLNGAFLSRLDLDLRQSSAEPIERESTPETILVWKDSCRRYDSSCTGGKAVIAELGRIIAENVTTIVQGVLSFTIASFAVITWRESRRQARIRQITKRLELLYSPVYHAIEASNGNLFEQLNIRKDEGFVAYRQYWNEDIAPRMAKQYYLASPQLQEIYWNIRRVLQETRRWDKESERAFCRRASMEYARLVRDLNKLSGEISLGRGIASRFLALLRRFSRDKSS